MKMFIFYFTVFFVETNGGTPTTALNSFVYKSLDDCRAVEFAIIGKNELHNCLEKIGHYKTNDPNEIETLILRDLAKKFQNRKSITQ